MPEPVEEHRAAVEVGLIPVPAAVVDQLGVVTEANPALVELVERAPVGRPLLDLLVPAARPVIQALLADPASGRSELARLAESAPTVRLAELSVAPSAAGTSVVVFVVPRARELDLIEDLTARAHDLLGQGLVMGDGTRILHVSETAAEIFARPVAELVGMGSLFGLFEAGEQTRLRNLIASRQAAGEPVPDYFETIVERPDGSLVPVELWVKAVVDGPRVRTYTLISDASERRQRQRELAHQATHDHLTGLPNRYLLLDRLDTLVKQLARRPRPASLCFIDLDRFKEVNDQYGHAVGDAVLQATAHRLMGGLRSCDTVARLGGDEFVVLCGDATDHDRLESMAKRLGAVLEEPVSGEGWTVEVGASVGTLTLHRCHRGPRGPPGQRRRGHVRGQAPAPLNGPPGAGARASAGGRPP